MERTEGWLDVVNREKSPIITLLTEEVDDCYKELAGKELTMENEPKNNPRFNIYHFFLSDPDGYTMEKQCFL